jgi:transposase
MTRFTGSSIGAYVGLVPSEYSSGNSRVQGSITKAGNTHVRRLLIESALHHRKPYSTSGPPLVANVAIARELAGWCWSLATRH